MTGRTRCEDFRPYERNPRSTSMKWNHVVTSEEIIMNQYEHRVALVVEALKAAKVHPAKGKTLSEAAVAALAAVDTIPETLR
jgi:hypothetical protein